MTTNNQWPNDGDGDDSGGIGGNEPFCEHGNLLWSEDCDECDEALMAISEKIAAAERREFDHRKGRE